MNKELRLNNKGFSLVELIVTVLITSVLMIGVIAFMSTSRSAYQTVNVSATLQEESMTVKRVVSEFLMEAKAYGCEKETINGTANCTVLWMLARETESSSSGEGDQVYFFVLDPVDHKLRYCKGSPTLVSPTALDSVGGTAITYIKDHCYSDNGKYTVIGEHLESITLNKVARPEGTDLVCIKMKYRYPESGGQEYVDEITVVTRNTVKKYSGSGEGISGEGTSGEGTSGEDT